MMMNNMYIKASNLYNNKLHDNSAKIKVKMTISWANYVYCARWSCSVNTLLLRIKELIRNLNIFLDTFLLKLRIIENDIKSIDNSWKIWPDTTWGACNSLITQILQQIKIQEKLKYSLLTILLFTNSTHIATFAHKASFFLMAWQCNPLIKERASLLYDCSCNGEVSLTLRQENKFDTRLDVKKESLQCFLVNRAPRLKL